MQVHQADCSTVLDDPAIGRADDCVVSFQAIWQDAESSPGALDQKCARLSCGVEQRASAVCNGVASGGESIRVNVNLP